MQKNLTQSGSYPLWESDAVELLKTYENRQGHRLPKGELLGRAFQRLSRATITSPAHLKALVATIVNQVLVDYGRALAREQAHLVYGYADDDLPAPENTIPDWVHDRWDQLLNSDSPLDEVEKAMLQTAREDPAQFIRKNGQLAQSALASHFGLDQTTIHYRWKCIREKIGALASPDPEMS